MDFKQNFNTEYVGVLLNILFFLMTSPGLPCEPHGVVVFRETTALKPCCKVPKCWLHVNHRLTGVGGPPNVTPHPGGIWVPLTNIKINFSQLLNMARNVYVRNIDWWIFLIQFLLHKNDAILISEIYNRIWAVLTNTMYW